MATVTITWADGVRGTVDFTLLIARGELLAALNEPDDLVRARTILHGGIGLTWPNESDISADGLRQHACPDVAEAARDQPIHYIRALPPLPTTP